MRRRRGLRKRSEAPEEAVGQVEFLMWVQVLEAVVKAYRNARMKTFQHLILRWPEKRKRPVRSEGNKVTMNDYCMTMTVDCDVFGAQN